MTESNFIKDNFFFIDSSNLDQIQSRLYGFVFHDNKLYINSKNGLFLYPSDLGVYLNIIVDENTICIQQEYSGKIPIYLYKKNDYFACSNSLLYLVKQIYTMQRLSFDEKFAQYILTDALASRLYRSTLVEEIIFVPRNLTIYIDKKKKNIFFKKTPLDIESHAINTPEGISILDEWYTYYASLVSSLTNMGGKIYTDLSGGFDSRAVFTIFASDSNVLHNCRINTSTDKRHTHPEDLKIASKIAQLFGCTINKKIHCYSYPISVLESLSISFFTKMTFHKQMYFKRRYQREHFFHFTGAGGECIRRYWTMPHNSITNHVTQNKPFSKNWYYNIDHIIKKSVNEIIEEYSTTNNYRDTIARLYRNGRCRYHFGLAAFEEFLGGSLCIQPLLDYRLEALNPFIENNTDRSLIIALIYTRYAPQLIDVNFDSKKALDKKTISLAQKINKLFPFSSHITTNNIEIIDDTEIYPKEKNDTISPNELMFQIFQAPEIATEIISIYGKDAYDTALRERKEKMHHGDALLCMELSVALIKKLCDKSKLVLTRENYGKKRKNFFDIPE